MLKGHQVAVYCTLVASGYSSLCGEGSNKCHRGKKVQQCLVGFPCSFRIKWFQNFKLTYIIQHPIYKLYNTFGEWQHLICYFCIMLIQSWVFTDLNFCSAGELARSRPYCESISSKCWPRSWVTQVYGLSCWNTWSKPVGYKIGVCEMMYGPITTEYVSNMCKRRWSPKLWFDWSAFFKIHGWAKRDCTWEI